MNRGSLGARAMNVHLQDGLNRQRGGEPVVERFGWQFRLGDKVIQTENKLRQGRCSTGILARLSALIPEERELAIRSEERDVRAVL